ncbi:hypothetical protein OS493_015920 [Desmophyllum pertusum]|uniref:G-protein coupled receptors family 1 profile domain-containing protein n=1 Tax=Desmophyllum pertusum TaxID=174260 RepID=A0A9W9YCX4_9CNID|nr:hypothetical protein OS493_015920 [Desmophyllum pertusum]
MNSTQNATNTTRDYGDEMYIDLEAFTILILSLLAVATVVSNGVFLWTFYKDPLKCLRTPSAIFIAGLTSANFLTGLIVEPAFVVFYLWQYISDSEDVVDFLHFASVFFFITMNTSYLIMLALAIIQYLLVKCPRIYQKFVSPKSALVGVIAIWIYAIFFAVLPEMFALDIRAFFLADLVLHITLLTVVLVVLYIAIYYEFRKLAQRHRNADLGENTEGERSSAEPTESEQQRRRAEKDFVYGTFILTLILIITVWPFCITLYLTMCCFSWKVYISLMISQLFLLWKFALDPFVFAWRLRKFRKSLVVAMQTTCLCPKPSLLVLHTSGKMKQPVVDQRLMMTRK